MSEPFFAGMAELADAADSKSAGLRPLGVRLPLPAPMIDPITLLASTTRPPKQQAASLFRLTPFTSVYRRFCTAAFVTVAEEGSCIFAFTDFSGPAPNNSGCK